MLKKIYKYQKTIVVGRIMLGATAKKKKCLGAITKFPRSPPLHVCTGSSPTFVLIPKLWPKVFISNAILKTWVPFVFVPIWSDFSQHYIITLYINAVTQAGILTRFNFKSKDFPISPFSIDSLSISLFLSLSI